MHRPGGWAAVGLYAAIVGLAIANAASTLDERTLRSLIVMDDRQAASVAVEQIDWLPGGGMIISGWERWPDLPTLVAFEADVRLPAALRPLQFFPRFAISPDGHRLTCWHRIGEGMEAQAQLTTVDLATGNVSSLGSPQRFLSAGKLVHATPDTVIAACQPEGGGILLYKAGNGRCRVLARLEDMVYDDLTAEPDGEHVVVVCAGQPKRYYRINWRAGVWAEVEPSLYSGHAGEALPPGVGFDAAAGRLFRMVGDA
ncbi:MAG: hypothetical protein J7M38_03030, partial [Armatimonadetes bacterium]|nr:hypothetical protein [Armatimonadota bacterium]